MSESKQAQHTPGEWYAELDENGVDWLVKSDTHGTIVHRNVYPDEKVDTTAEADARLIAAAPELLAAAERALEWMQNPDRQTAGQAFGMDASLRTAIARAKGGE